jgi:predicted nucleotidyltransferase
VRPDSDYDVLLVAEGLADDPFDRARQVRLPLLELTGIDVQVLARTPGEFEADVTPLHLDLAVDAVVLRERDGYLAERLRRLRELLGEAGLERGADLFWRWRVPPRRPDWAITWNGVRT